MRKVRIAKFLVVALTAILFIAITSGCTRYDPSDDVELYWPEWMEKPNEESTDGKPQPNESGDNIRALAAPESHIQETKAFKKKNQDAVGWLYIPDTSINEVVVQDPESNDTYHRANNLGKYAFNGCLYADYESRISGDANQISPNIVIYGHSMTDIPDSKEDEKKFTQLKKLLDKDFAETHPYIFFSSATQDYVYEIFAAMYTNKDDFYYIDCALDGTAKEIEDSTGMDMATLVKTAKEGSIFDYPAAPTEEDKIISLSTCSYKFGDASNEKQRFIVFGRLLREGDDMPETITIIENTDVIFPNF